MARATVPVLPPRPTSKVKFVARKVPDFARIHAAEEARKARFKESNKHDKTVPKGFKFIEKTKEPEETGARSEPPKKVGKVPLYVAAQGPLTETHSPIAPEGNDPAKALVFSPPSCAKARLTRRPNTTAARSGLNRSIFKPDFVHKTEQEHPSGGNCSQHPKLHTQILPPPNQLPESSKWASPPIREFVVSAREDEKENDRTKAGSAPAPQQRPASAVPPLKRELPPRPTSGTSAGTLANVAFRNKEPVAPLRPSRPSSAPSPAAPRRTHESGSASSGASVETVPSSTSVVSRPDSAPTRGRQKPDVQRLRQMINNLSPENPRQPFSSVDFYSFGAILGEGAYGKVKIGTHLLTGEKVAVKTFEKTRLVDPNSRKRVDREIRILKALSHPHVIKLFEVIDCPTRKYVVMEIATGGDLCKYVREKRRLPETEARRLFCQIVEGLLYCHTVGIVHRDVKLDNLLMDANHNVKIVDFGFSIPFHEGQKLRMACGSPSYAAPEIVSRKPYNPPGVDVWSLGVVLYAMIAGYFPFRGANTQELCRKIVRGKFETPEWMSPEAKDLVRRMLLTDPSKRVALWNIRQHNWCRTAVAAATTVPPIHSPVRPVQVERSVESRDGDLEPVMEASPDVIHDLHSIGFPPAYSTHCVERNMHNLASTSYWLLHNKRNQASREQDRALGSGWGTRGEDSGANA